MNSDQTSTLLAAALAGVALLFASPANANYGSSCSANSNTNPPTASCTVALTPFGSGGNGTGTPGVCYITSVTGAFRGAGEGVRIETASNGDYELYVEEDMGWGGGTGHGPEASMNCLSASQLYMPSGHISNYNSVTHDPHATAQGIGSFTETNTMALVAWSGAEGFLWWNNAASDLDIASSATYQSPDWTVGVEENFVPGSGTYACQPGQCMMTTFSYDTKSSVNGQGFSILGGSWNNNPCGGTATPYECTLAPGYSSTSPSSVCWIAGILGYWTHDSSASITHSGSDWVLEVTTGDTGEGGTYAYAMCMSIESVNSL